MATPTCPSDQIRSVISPASVAGGQTRSDLPGNALKIVTDRQSPMAECPGDTACRGLPVRAVIDLW